MRRLLFHARFSWFPTVFAALLCIGSTAAAANSKVPDFAKGEVQQPANKKHTIRDRAMGPTGLWGMVYSQSMDKGATRDARQFRITRVEAGSPAEGTMRIDDVVIGAAGKTFEADARKQLAAAIEHAEQTNGKLSLRVWREGKTTDLTLQLKVMGAFDPNSPLDCAYAKAVEQQMIAHAVTVKLPPEERAKDERYPFMPTMAALGMLGSGDPALMAKVKAHAHWLCINQKTGEPITFDVSPDGKRVWNTSYNLIFLSEYYLATGDETVLPAIRTLAVGAAMGQSGVGSYGHRFSSRQDDGSYHGPLLGYGAINNASLSMATGLLLARECGIDHPEVHDAIARSKRFFDFFIEHGGIPYGDHWAGTDYYDNNGTSALSAIVYDLLGDQRGQAFFAAMAVASAPTGREEGHQGCYWSNLWADLGATRSGKAGLNASLQETSYIRTLERGWNGQVIDQSNIGHKYGSRGDVTGERLLWMSLGRKSLYLSGKKTTVEHPLEGPALADALEGGRLIYHPERRAELSEEEIFRLLRHELPATRITAAKAMREQGLKRVDRLVALINDDDRHARYGACNGLAYAGWDSPEAVDAVVKRMLSDDDILFRYFAVDALSSGKGHGYGLHGAAGPAVPALLKLASEPAANDPRGHLCWQIAEALFYHQKALFASYPPEGPEAEALLTKSLAQFLLNENGRARSAVRFDTLSERQLSKLWTYILHATRENAPSGIMFSKGVRTSGLATMAKYRIKEGLDLMMELAQTELTDTTMWVPWHAETMVDVLPLYGRDALPVLDIIEQWVVLEKRGAELAKKLPALRKELESAPKLELTPIR